MPRIDDLTGKRFGQLVVTRFAETSRGRRRWSCLCDCGNETVVSTSQLTCGVTRSCGCGQARGRVAARAAITTHGMSKTVEFQAWTSMLTRCFNPNAQNYARYGGREITVCDRWRYSFEAFFHDLGPRPADHSLDRVDNDGDYEPGNVRWADARTQAANRAFVLSDVCQNGHDRSEHSYFNGKIRVCRECGRDKARRYRARKARVSQEA